MFLYVKIGYFGVKKHTIQEQIATMKVKKNPGKPGNFWLGQLDSNQRHTD